MELNNVEWTMNIPHGMVFFVFLVAIIFIVVTVVINWRNISNKLLFWLITRKNKDMFSQLCAHYGTYNLMSIAYYLGIYNKALLFKIALVDFISSGKIDSKENGDTYRMILNKRNFSSDEFRLICEVMNKGGDIIITNPDEVKGCVNDVTVIQSKISEKLLHDIIENNAIPLVENDIWYLKEYVKRNHQRYPKDIDDILDKFLNFETIDKRIILVWILGHVM
mgnify:CR=1 FL=1